MMDTLAMTAARSIAMDLDTLPLTMVRIVMMVALVTVNALTVSARATMDSEEHTARIAAPETVSAAAETVNALSATAIAILDGLVTVAIFAPACTIAPNMDTATTVPVCAKRDTEVVTAPYLRSHNLANALFTVFVDVFSNAHLSTKRRVLGHLMNAIPSAHKSAFLNVSLERCPSTFWVLRRCRLSRLINSACKWSVCS